MRDSVRVIRYQFVFECVDGFHFPSGSLGELYWNSQDGESRTGMTTPDLGKSSTKQRFVRCIYKHLQKKISCI